MKKQDFAFFFIFLKTLIKVKYVYYLVEYWSKRSAKFKVFQTKNNNFDQQLIWLMYTKCWTNIKTLRIFNIKKLFLYSFSISYCYWSKKKKPSEKEKLFFQTVQSVCLSPLILFYQKITKISKQNFQKKLWIQNNLSWICFIFLQKFCCLLAAEKVYDKNVLKNNLTSYKIFLRKTFKSVFKETLFNQVQKCSSSL